MQAAVLSAAILHSIHATNPASDCTATMIEQATHSNKFLWGNLAPVDGNFYVHHLPVAEGRIPPELAGLFARNGLCESRRLG